MVGSGWHLLIKEYPNDCVPVSQCSFCSQQKLHGIDLKNPGSGGLQKQWEWAEAILSIEEDRC